MDSKKTEVANLLEQALKALTGLPPVVIPDGHFQCECCGRVFPDGWSEDEAKAESHHYFGDIPQEDLASICDDCWKAIHPDRN